MIIVGSQRKGSLLNPPLGATIVRIDRVSVLGNPFDMGSDETLRERVVGAHRAWLDVILERGQQVDAVRLATSMAQQLGLKIASSWKQSSAEAIIRELYDIAQAAEGNKDVWILCWCVPAACHGDAYKAAIEDGRVEATYARLYTTKASPEPPLIPDWRSAITPEAIAQTTFEHSGRWIKNWFSNFGEFDQPLLYQDIAYTTPEVFYQAMKTQDLAERAQISAMTPDQAKRAGKQVNLRLDWEQVKERYMEVALRHKFKPGTSWHQRLINTRSQPIVELNNWHDNFWGACICSRCQPKPKHNRLGVLLMTLRSQYQISGSQRDEGLEPALRAAPQHIGGLEPNQVFVFGANTEGKHGKGAARAAFGEGRFRYDGSIGKWAVYGQGRGLMQGHEGMSYGIVTKDLKAGERSIPLAEIESQIDELIQFAQSRTDLEFLVTPFGTALAGYSHAEIARLWQGKSIPGNVRLPQVWLKMLTGKKRKRTSR